MHSIDGSSVGRSLGIWDYHMQEPLYFSGATRKERYIDSAGYYEGRIWNVRTAKFIAPKKWIVVGCDDGYIKVYSCMALRNFKGSKSCLFSKTKKFQAYDYDCDMSLDVHPTGPFVLSACCYNYWTTSGGGSGKIKLWDWDKGWDCIRTFDMHGDSSQVKFNPIDPNHFVSVSSKGDTKVWNVNCPRWESTLSGAKDVECFDFFTRDGELYLITAHSTKKIAMVRYGITRPSLQLKRSKDIQIM